jgi:hypothetical protein
MFVPLLPLPLPGMHLVIEPLDETARWTSIVVAVGAAAVLLGGFRERTAWSLLNAFTEVLKDRQQRQPSRSRPRDDHPAKTDRRRVWDALTSRLTDDLAVLTVECPLCCVRKLFPG